MTHYQFMFEGTAADGQTWMTEGTVTVMNEGQFGRALDEAQSQSFLQLTRGKAVYGKPGVGCKGPYRINKFVINRIEEN